MERSELMVRVQSVFRDVFDDQALVIGDSTNSQDIEEWDSLGHITLVTAIEKDLKIRFALGELQELKNVGEMIDLIREKKLR